MKTIVAAPDANHGQGPEGRAIVPLVKRDTQAAGSRARTKGVAAGVDPLARKANAGRVLIVDDDPAMRMLCAINLQLEGLVVLEAESGRHGLAQARSERPDLVLTDVSMPSFDGFQLAEALRSETAHARSRSSSSAAKALRPTGPAPASSAHSPT